MDGNSTSRPPGEGAVRTSKNARRIQYATRQDDQAYYAPLSDDIDLVGVNAQGIESRRASAECLEDEYELPDPVNPAGNMHGDREVSQLEKLDSTKSGIGNHLGSDYRMVNTSSTQSSTAGHNNPTMLPEPSQVTPATVTNGLVGGTHRSQQANKSLSSIDFDHVGYITTIGNVAKSVNIDMAPALPLASHAVLLQRSETPTVPRPVQLRPIAASPQAINSKHRRQLRDPSSAYNGAISEKNDSNAQEHTDGHSPENVRPATQALRYGGFPAPQAPQHRSTPLGSGRLQNINKLGNGASWGFGAPNGNLANGPSRQPGATSFAQTIGGSQPSANLDLSEFPSLSGTSQPQYQNASQAVWANQRAIQQTPVQRPQQQQQQQHVISPQAPQQHQQSQQPQDQPQRVNDDIYSSTSHLQSAMDDSRYQSALGHMPATRQPQTTSVDDFPPLGRHGTDENDDGRVNMMHASGYGGFSNSNAFSLPPDQVQLRNSLASASDSQANNTRSPSVVDRLTSPNGNGFDAMSSGRSPVDSNRQGNAAIHEHDRNNVPGILGNQRSENNMNSLLTNPNDSQYPSQQPRNQSSEVRQDYANRPRDPIGATHMPDQTTHSQMSAKDEFGLVGFLATITHENPDVSGLARGHDLTSLGLNLNSSEALHPTFAGPFAETGSRPIQPDFKLPECYTVDNVPPVREKVPSFSDETLFWIFYTQPRDILQELAASELTNRNWRYHTGHHMWLTKDPSLDEPVSMGPEKEQGSYIVFVHTKWEKIRVSGFDLHYKELAPTSSRPNGA